MFGLSFSELMVIGVVLLIVLGPERFPRVAKTAGLLIGRAQRYVNDLKEDLEKEMKVDELKKLKEDIHSSVSEFEEGMRANVETLKQPINDIKSQSEALDQKLKKNFDSALNREQSSPEASESDGRLAAPSSGNPAPAAAPEATGSAEKPVQSATAAAGQVAAPAESPGESAPSGGTAQSSSSPSQ